jgi:hypothetical protein
MKETQRPLPVCLYGLLRGNFYLIFAPSFCPNKPLNFSFWRFFIDGWTKFFPLCKRTVSCHTDFRKTRKQPSDQIISVKFRDYLNVFMSTVNLCKIIFISLHSVFSISDRFSLIRLPFRTGFYTNIKYCRTVHLNSAT